MKLIFVLHAIGPCLLGYSLAYLLKNPHDWTGPTVLSFLSLGLTILAQLLGKKLIRKTMNEGTRKILIATQIAGPFTGLMVFLMMYFGLLN